MLYDFINDIVNKFNENGDLYFNITSNIQQFYDNNIFDKDGRPYVVGILSEYDLPIVKDFYTTRTREFELVLKAHANLEDEIRTIIYTDKKFEADDKIYYFGNMNVSDVKTESYGKDKILVFYGSLRISVEVPIYVTGKDVTVSIDGVDVRVIQANETHDKALLSNVEFGENTSDINTGSEHIYTFALDGNVKTTALFTDIKNKTYNKSYNFVFNYGVVSQTISLVLRRGVVNWGYNSNTITFICVFERALPRTTIKIDNTSVEAMSFVPQMTTEIRPIQRDGMNKIYEGARTKVYNFYLVNDGGSIIQSLISDYKDNTKDTYELEYKINNETITNKVVLISLLMATSENPNAVFNVTFGEKVDDGK